MPPAAEVSVFSPGNITITQITSKEYLESQQPNFKPHTDYILDFSLCKEFRARFDHVASLSEKIKKYLAASTDYCKTYSTDGTTINSCSQKVNIKLSPGDMIGTVGSPNGSNALDFGAYDYRIKPHVYSNPSRWGPNIYAVCPVDYFHPQIRDLLNAKFGDWTGKQRTEPPVCGEVDQDKINTAQGNWFLKGTTQTYPEDPHLALVHDNFDPSKGVFSVGVSMEKFGLKSGYYYFEPKNSGFINRNFSEVSDENIYCYEAQTRFQQPSAPGKFVGKNVPEKTSGKIVILIQLKNSNTISNTNSNIDRNVLTVEKADLASCDTGPWSFGSKFVEFER